MRYLKQLIFIGLFIAGFLSAARAQKSYDYTNADQVGRNVPDSIKHSVAKLSDYFNKHLHSQRDLIRAF